MSCELCSCGVIRIQDENDYNIWATIAAEVFPSLKALTAVPIICLPCKQMLLKGRRFKDILLETEEHIKNYCNKTSKPHPVKLVNVLRSLGRDPSVKNNFGICRICLEVNREAATTLSVNSNQVLAILSFIPEMNLQATLNPVICTDCREEVRQIHKFQMKCEESLENISSDRSPQIGESGVNSDTKTTTVSEVPDSDNEELSPNELDIEEDSDEGSTIYVSDSDEDTGEIKIEIEERNECNDLSFDSKSQILRLCEISESGPLKLHQPVSVDEAKLEDPSILFESKNVFTCKICEYMASLRKDILEHIKIHQKNGQGVLENEEKNEPNSVERARKKSGTGKECVFECVTCAFFYPTKESLLHHMEEIHENISKSTPTAPNLRKRKSNDDFIENNPYFCNICLQSFLTVSRFRYHSETVHNVTISKFRILKFGDQKCYKCVNCGLTAASMREMGEHQHSAHSDDWFLKKCASKKGSQREFACHKCSYKSTDEASFDNHLAKHIKGTTIDTRSSRSSIGNNQKEQNLVTDKKQNENTVKRSFFKSKRIDSVHHYDCNLCTFKCIGRSLMISHLKNIHNEDIMRAKSSNNENNNESKVKQKNKSEINENTTKRYSFTSKRIDSVRHYNCTLCTFTCIGRSLMISHLQNVHNKNILRWKNNSTSSSNNKNINHDESRRKQNHLTNTTNTNNNKNKQVKINKVTLKPYLFSAKKIDSTVYCNCTLCTFNCIGRSLMISHLKNIHNEDVMKPKTVMECSLCGDKFKQLGTFTNHKKKCGEAKKSASKKKVK